MSLKPIRCAACGSPVPLVEAAETACAYCAQPVAIPADYLEAARLHHAGAEARAAAEPLWRRFSARVGWRVQLLGLLLLALLPPLVTLLANLSWPYAAQAQLFGLLTLPALLPGSGIWIWAAVVNATTLPYREALSAKPPAKGEGPVSCRSCGAPLAVEPEALSATCLYCGADSLLEVLPVSELGARLRDSLRTLEEAARTLRKRRVLLALSVTAVLLMVAAVSWVLVWGTAQTL